MRFALFFALPGLLGAQLIPAGQPVPKGPNPPVVFLNGYQSGCSGTDFASNFGGADKLLQASSIVTLYFDNCTLGGTGSSRPSIEAEGAAFGQFLAALKYTDGSAVTQVDTVAHSMGGLIVRAYLSGKQDGKPNAPGVFAPPANPVIRRAIFLGTPHFGTSVAALLGSIDRQTDEMTPGSQFLFDLNSWNDGGDDLRGVAGLSIAGNGGTGQESGTNGFDDGVVALTSSSLGFYRGGVTRVVPYCHTANSLLTLFGFCPSAAPPLNIFSTDPNSLVGQLLVSFLTGTNAWQSVGTAAESASTLSATSGIILQLRDQNDAVVQVIGGSAANQNSGSKTVTLGVNQSSNLGFNESLTSGAAVPLQVTPLSGTTQMATVALPATTSLAGVVKPGPSILPKGIIPAAGPAPFPYDVAAGAYVSIYGTNLASATMGAGIPYPTQIGDVQVLVNGVAVPLVFVSAGQINFVYSNAGPGLTTVTVKNMNGQNTVNMRVAAAVPSIFLLDANGTAAAVNATSGAVVGPNAPLHVGNFLSLYVTGLGATTRTGGLDYAQLQPTLTVGGQNCAVTYAGLTPGFAGLNQINCQIPAGVPTGAAVPVVVNSNGRLSSTAFVAIQ